MANHHQCFELQVCSSYASQLMGDAGYAVAALALCMWLVVRVISEILMYLNSSSKYISTNNTDTCSVCLGDLRVPPGMDSRGGVTFLRSCGHAFHSDCIQQWVDTGHPSCPLCRCPVSSY